MIQLRDYQSDVIDQLRDGFVAGHKRQVLSASTGAGKSIIMLEMIRLAMDTKGKRVLFICERRNLVDQFSKHLDSIGIRHGVLMSKHFRFAPGELVQVASAQTLERMDTLPAFDICFIDEAHAALRKSVMQLMDKFDKFYIGATATPFNKNLSKYFTNVVSAPPMVELVAHGSLVPFRVFVAKEVDTTGVKTNTKGEWVESELEERGKRITGDVVADYLRLSQEVYGRKSKAILFSCGIAHGAELEKAFSDAGVNAVQLASGVDEDYRQDAFREFAKPNSSIDLLISVDMLSRGFDQTDIEHVILARPVKKSFSTHVQMIGRGARKHTGKEFCVIQDHGGNWLRFETEWESFYNDGVKTLSDAPDTVQKKEPTAKEKEAAKCPKCGALWVGRSLTCLHCGYVRVLSNDVVTTAGEMFELESGSVKKEKYSQEYKADWYGAMCAHLRANNKKEGRAYHLYKEKFGVYPSNTFKKTGYAVTQEVVDYLMAANIKYAKRIKK
jgi:superfamily II DNA or RNA helicase